MSAHADLIAFGAYVLVIAIPAVWYYLWTLHRLRVEQYRHNRAVERASWRLYWQIRRLGDCDGDDDE